MPRAYRLGELAQRVDGRVHGDPDLEIRGIATLDRAGAHDLSFLTNPRYRAAAGESRAAAILVGPESGLSDHALLEAAEPYLALATLLELIYPQPAPAPGISGDARVGEQVEIGPDVRVEPFALIGDGASLGARVVIGAGSVVGTGCRVGADTQLRPRVVLYPDTEVGERCLLHAGVVLGGDGFGFASHGGEHHKVPQVGRVVVEDDVEIGANSAVDRAMLGETRIGKGTKIDDLVMVAHGVQLGPGSLLAGQAGIAGSARLGARVVLAGQTGVAGHLTVGDRAIVAAKSAVFDDLPDGAFVAGVPAIDQRKWKRAQALFKKLPELKKEIRELRRRVEDLERRPAGED